ncbi:hypothetical protein [Nocardioides zeae]|uniref:Uncharacterized protein n=1 Tax=Nocardioides zeae TaxID=1457234 RepID=A0A6P0HEK0_9ACTN|nr:hypothetical protein [Nocardioides zeae]NEN76737.1 hypothetical protein [Nocardioides zeae]
MDISTHAVRRGTALALTTLLAGVALSACSDSDDESSPTVTVTETVTSSATASASSPTSTPTEPGGSSTASSAPTSGSAATGPLPTDAQGYAQALIDAWQAGDRAAAERLVRDPDEVDDLFDEDDLTGDPVFAMCEGAAGSSYCTWNGTGYDIVVRVANETASAGQEGAISEVDVED